jgi:hypothetical protein
MGNMVGRQGGPAAVLRPAPQPATARPHHQRDPPRDSAAHALQAAREATEAMVLLNYMWCVVGCCGGGGT